MAEDEQGTVRIVNGGFKVDRDGVGNAPATSEASESESSAPEANTPEATAPAEATAPGASAPAEATAPAAEQQKDAPAGVQGAPAQNVSAQNASAQKVEAQASGSQKVASGAQQKREQLAATGASNMLVISAAGSLSLLAGMRLSRRRRSEMRLSSRH